MQKILPIAVPPIIGYLHHAYPLSILANWTTYLPWFYSNYIQLYCPKNLIDSRQDRTVKFDFYLCPDQPISFQSLSISPYLKVRLLHRDLIFKSPTDIASFIIACIDEGYYVRPTVDEYFLHYSPAYKKRHFVHEILIYGYDNQTFVGIGFDKKGDYAAYPIAFAELEQAVVHADLTGHYDPDGLRLFKYDPQAEYDFDIQLVREHLEDFLYAKNTSQRFRMLANPTDGAYGLATYECLKHYIKSFFVPPFSFDIRPMHILWEHKICMAYRLKYMEAQGYLKSEDGFFIQYDEVARKIGVLRMMLLKFRKTRSPALIHRVCLHLDAIAEAEKGLLQNLLDNLESVCCESR